MLRQATVRAKIRRVRAGGPGEGVAWDLLAAEGPLEIRLGVGQADRRSTRSVAVTMRTPGNDDELAIGLLLAERIIPGPEAIAEVGTEAPEDCSPRGGEVIRVDLHPEITIDFRRFDRNFFATSSCGVCGKASLRALGLDEGRPLHGVGAPIDAELIYRWPEALRRRQSVFEATGGLHGSALMAIDGRFLAVREDIGRHNAVDKLMGARSLGTLDGPAADSEAVALLVSGRVGFEIVQKAVAGGIPIVLAVGAPSSLAVEVAEAFGLTLIGFVGPERFNIYCGDWRVRETPDHVVRPVRSS
ncbi:formate dehydrogenase accessory sulfurtransferase FdhD [soil metagenome]